MSESCLHNLLTCCLMVWKLLWFVSLIFILNYFAEYAYTLRVNEKSDIYSFGVVILEIVTWKRPIAPELGEKDLVKWVCSTLDQKGVEHVIDPKLDFCFKEEISKILNIGLLCTSLLPINRPSMRRVVKMLQEIGGVDDERNMSREDKDGKLTPYYSEEASDQGSVAWNMRESVFLHKSSYFWCLKMLIRALNQNSPPLILRALLWKRESECVSFDNIYEKVSKSGSVFQFTENGTIFWR